MVLVDQRQKQGSELRVSYTEHLEFAPASAFKPTTKRIRRCNEQHARLFATLLAVWHAAGKGLESKVLGTSLRLEI